MSSEPSHPPHEERRVCRRLLVLNTIRQYVHLLLNVLTLNHLSALLVEPVLQNFHLLFQALGSPIPIDVVLHRFRLRAKFAVDA